VIIYLQKLNKMPHKFRKESDGSRLCEWCGDQRGLDAERDCPFSAEGNTNDISVQNVYEAGIISATALLTVRRLCEERKYWRKYHLPLFYARPGIRADDSTDLMKWHAGVPGKEGKHLHKQIFNILYLNLFFA